MSEMSLRMPAPPDKDEEAALSASDIVLVAFDGVEAIDVAGPASVFTKAEQMRPGNYRLHIASPAGGAVSQAWRDGEGRPAVVQRT
jgi:hypothetical protein